MTQLDPRTDLIIFCMITGRTNMSGHLIADGIAAYRRAPLQPQIGAQPVQADNSHAQPVERQFDAENATIRVSDNGSGGGRGKSQRTSKRTKARTAQRTRNATQKVLDYLEDHPSDTALSTDTLLLKLAKARIKVGRSSVGKALGIARVNGHG